MNVSSKKKKSFAWEVGGCGGNDNWFTGGAKGKGERDFHCLGCYVQSNITYTTRDPCYISWKGKG